MSYTAPDGNAVTGSWVGAGLWSGPIGYAVTASWFVLPAFSRAVYRLYLVTGDESVEIPFSAMQCRRKSGAKTWLTAEIPIYTDSLLAQCRAHIGSDVSILLGGETLGAEYLVPFLYATLTEVSSSWSPRVGSITLTARVDEPAPGPRTRAPKVERSGKDGGRRTARCAVDAEARPGDVVDDGAGAWTVGSITYRIGPRSAWMDLTEVDDG